MRFLILILVFAFHASAETNDLIHSAGFSIYTVSSESELQDHEQRKALTFRPNVSTGLGLGIETKYIGLAYSFSGREAQEKDFDKSKFSDIRLNFHYSHFDFRLNYQSYRGALVDAGGREEFYKDYEVKSKNMRIHYYLNDDHLNYIRDGRKLVDRLVKNDGLACSQSFFLGLNADSRSIDLPENLVPEHMARVTARGIKYDRSFSALSLGPLIGYDILGQYESAFMRVKFAGGPAFQTGGGTVPQIEVAFNTGYAFFKHHLVSVGIDIYSLSFKDSDQVISNNNVMSGFSYRYAFN